jgi:hypothetical protein
MKKYRLFGLLILLLFFKANLFSQEINLTTKKVKSKVYSDLEIIYKYGIMNAVPFSVNGKYGYIDKKSKAVIIEPNYQDLNLFNPDTEGQYNDQYFFSISTEPNPTITVRDVNAEGLDISMDNTPWPRGPRLDNQIGFTTNGSGKLISYSKEYEKHARLHVINKQSYLIVNKAGRYGIIDSVGNIMPHFNFAHIYLTKEGEIKGEDDWFRFTDSLGVSGFINLKGKIKMRGEVGQRNRESYFGLEIIEIDDLVGILDMEKLKWVIKPQEEKIRKISYSSKKVITDYSKTKDVNIFFQIWNGRDMYYMDKKGYIYLPKSSR